MSYKYTTEQLQQIVDDLIEELRECEDGTCITTALLLEEAGYELEDFRTTDLLVIHSALFEAAEINHITLDMSAHRGRLEGLAHNLDYVVHNKDAQVKCPYCGSRNTARILYGMPAFNEEMERKLEAGKIVLGGCCIMTVPVGGDREVVTGPERKCNECRKEFGKPPLIISKDYSSAEDYRDVVESIKFSIRELRGGNLEITIRKKQTGALAKVSGFLFSPDPDLQEDRQITAEEWSEILEKLYCSMYLHEWKKHFEVEEGICVMDGESWKLQIKLAGNRVRNYHGENAYPPYWPELKEIFRKYASI